MSQFYNVLVLRAVTQGKYKSKIHLTFQGGEKKDKRHIWQKECESLKLCTDNKNWIHSYVLTKSLVFSKGWYFPEVLNNYDSSV